MGTLARPLAEGELERTQVVKVVTGVRGDALYFSRAPIPHRRDGGVSPLARAHVGIYAYTAAFLEEFTALPPGRLEGEESLEQLGRSSTASRSGWPTRATAGSGSTRRRTWSGRGRSWSRPDTETQHGSTNGEARQEDEVPVRHGRRGELARQGAVGGVDRRAAREPRARGPAPQARPLHQRGPGHHEPVPARRGLRHRRRRRDRPRPRPLRAVHHRQDVPEEQLHHRPHLPERHPAGAARRVPRQDRAGHPAHHRRDQGGDPRGGRRRRHPDRRGGRHRRRHRVAALPRGHPADEVRRGRGERGLRAPHPGPLHRRGRRAQDQAHPALGEGAARDRHPAGHPAVPLRPRPAARHEGQDRALLQRRPLGGLHRPRRGVDLRAAARPSTARGSTTSWPSSSTSGAAPRASTAGRPSSRR